MASGGSLACLYIPQFTLRAFFPQITAAAAVAEPTGVITEVSAAAWRQGVRPGQRVCEALGHCATLAIVEVTPEDAQRAFEPVVASLERCSPEVESDRPGRAYVGLMGLASLYRGMEGLARALLEAVPAPYRNVARLGMGGNKFVTWAASRQATAGTPLMLRRGEAGDFVAPLSISILPLEEEQQARLRLLGLRTLGQLAAVGVGPLQAQFGPLGIRLWEWSRGEDSTPFRPRGHSEAIEERLTLPAPIIAAEALAHAGHLALKRAFSRKERRGRWVRRLEVTLVFDTGAHHRLRVPLKEAASSPEAAWSPLRHYLEGMSLTRPVEELQLTLGELCGEEGRQANFFRERYRKHERELDEAVRQLRAQYPGISLGRIVEVEPWSRLPERRYVLEDYIP